MSNKKLLKSKIDDYGGVTKVAEEIKMDRSTLYRKINTGMFYVSELNSIKNVLGLSDNEANDIFF